MIGGKQSGYAPAQAGSGARSVGTGAIAVNGFDWDRHWITYRNGDVAIRVNGRWMRADRSHPVALAYRAQLEAWKWFYVEELYALRLRLGMVWHGVRVLTGEHGEVVKVIESGVDREGV